MKKIYWAQWGSGAGREEEHIRKTFLEAQKLNIKEKHSVIWKHETNGKHNQSK